MSVGHQISITNAPFMHDTMNNVTSHIKISQVPHEGSIHHEIVVLHVKNEVQEVLF